MAKDKKGISAFQAARLGNVDLTDVDLDNWYSYPDGTNVPIRSRQKRSRKKKIDETIVGVADQEMTDKVATVLAKASGRTLQIRIEEI